MTQLAGSNAELPAFGELGAVGWADFHEVVGHPEAHCDDADYLAAVAAQHTRAAATTNLSNCIQHMRSLFTQAVAEAPGMLDSKGHVIAAQVDPHERCASRFGGGGASAKCRTLLAFGRALHGVEDFYSHSNWTDQADPPYSAANPPGLDQPAPARPLLDLSATGKIPSFPQDLSTGCYTIFPDQTPLIGCRGRVVHANIAKDNGAVDPRSGAATGPTFPRGCGPMTDHSVPPACGLPTSSGANFKRAVQGAIIDVTQQWADLRRALVQAYPKTGSLLACVISHDEPQTTCRPPHLLYRAVVHGSYNCSGRCDDFSATAVHHYQDRWAFDISADVPLSSLPRSPDVASATGHAPVGRTTLVGFEPPSGAISDTYVNAHVSGPSDPECLSDVDDGHDEGTFARISPGPFDVVGLDAVGPPDGPPTDLDLVYNMLDHLDPSPVRDLWSTRFTATGPPHCTGTIVVDDNSEFLAYSLATATDGQESDVYGGGRELTGWTVTPDALDNVYAHRTISYSGSPRAGYNVTVRIDYQVVTDDSCVSPGVPPAPLVTCS
ncbi:hypothetical protein V3N99_21000 [Dermatophilaceae bacterium Soc4.6]